MTADSDPDFDLPLLTEAEEEQLALALRHAFDPTDIDPAVHERLLARALEDPFAPASAEELVESERLRRAFDGEGEHADLALARALAAAYSAKPPPPANVEAAINALEQKRAPRANVRYLQFGGVAAALAAAAAVVLLFGQQPSRAPAPDLQALTLAQSRSTAALFRTAGTIGAPSTRIDRIASVRERELRDNRYALWGVR